VSVGSPERVQTERMVCTRIVPEDAGELAVLLRDPRVAKTLFPHRDPPTDIEIDAHIVEKSDHWDRYGFGVWTLRDAGTGELVGRGGLQHTDATGVDEVELLWVVAPACWRQGLATELALAAVAVAFDNARLDDVIAYTLVDNRGSRRVMEKAGLRYERELEHVGLPHVLYRRRRC
jgi:ribosomal-protein-alanine N-acetyltransferase